METSDQIDPIYRIVAQIMEELGAPIRDGSDVTKSVLVRQGHYCGRAFQYGDIRAVWFAEANEIKFYRDQGPLLRAVRLDGASELCRAA